MAFLSTSFDAKSSVPLHRQLYDRLREEILSGRMRAGTRLPSTRALADDLSLSRNTVLNAFAQLLAEGFVEGQIGSGTYVARALPEGATPASKNGSRAPAAKRSGRTLSKRGKLLATTPIMAPREVKAAAGREIISFRPGVPAIDALLYKGWHMAARHWERLPRQLLNYGHAAGHEPLREAVAGYLNTARGVRCDARQVIIVNGSQQALDVAARVLLDPGDKAWIENPGFLGARGALLGAGATLVPVGVDESGIDVDAGMRRCMKARLAYVTPSYQYPLGVTMTLARRLKLLEWAARAGAWILEDDYDSEFRYSGRPLAALQGLDREGRVIYIGTFSKVLFPALRLGYLVVPPDLVDAFCSARALLDHHSPAVEQVMLANFINTGHFTRHIRRMRALYRGRQAVLLDAVHSHLKGKIEMRGADAGMHLLGWLPEKVSDRDVSSRAAAAGIEVLALSRFSIHPLKRGALIFGYTAPTEEQIREGIRRLAGLRLF